MSQNIIEITDNNFNQEVLQSNVPVIVDFWAEWCAPCRALTPILEEIAIDYADKIKVGKCNVDQNSTIPAQYSVRGIPTILAFKNGNLEGNKVGLQTKAQLAALLDGLLS